MSENGKEGANPAPNEAGKEADIYENRKGLKKLIRIITVMAYLVSVSFVALVLSGYYIFLWQPPTPENLGLRAEPRVEYLMENPPPVARVSNRSISELTEKMNVFIKSGIYQRKMNKTKMGITRMQENITGNFLQAILKSKEHFETSTSAYKPDGKLDEMMDDVTTSTESTTSVSLDDVSELSVRVTSIETLSSSTEIGNEYFENTTATIEIYQQQDSNSNVSETDVFNNNNDDDDVDYGDGRGRQGHPVFTEISTLSTQIVNGSSVQSTMEDEMSETTSTKQNSTDFLKKLKTIYPSVYIAEDQIIDESTELEADSLDTQPIIISSSSTMSSDELEEISEEAVDETLDVQFESQNLPRR